ncbi:TPA: hypothetical protein N0F65_002709 [Lagenidium giganteum]|uniref:Uncharacterized protein n=1 Tax=Lagenidium giganteum TaxID=4803 RepID=A0AAV2Z2D8_9STRA|nr:TPA: hypothetical protein N0F65_002709 [Lagenidium giganteum]
MGCGSSAEMLEQPLMELFPVALTRCDFCFEQRVTLHLKDSMADDFFIRSVQTNEEIFRIQGVTNESASRSKTLVGTGNQPILLIKRQLSKFSAHFDVFADANENRLLCTARCKMPVAFKPARRAVFWLQRGNSKKRVPVAKVYNQKVIANDMCVDSHDYFVEIAPGIGAGMIVMLCVMLDEGTKS